MLIQIEIPAGSAKHQFFTYACTYLNQLLNEGYFNKGKPGSSQLPSFNQEHFSHIANAFHTSLNNENITLSPADMYMLLTAISQLAIALIADREENTDFLPWLPNLTEQERAAFITSGREILSSLNNQLFMLVHSMPAGTIQEVN